MTNLSKKVVSTPWRKYVEFSTGLVWFKIHIMGKTRLIASQNALEALFSKVYRFMPGHLRVSAGFVCNTVEAESLKRCPCLLLSWSLSPAVIWAACAGLCWRVSSLAQCQTLSGEAKNKNTCSYLCTNQTHGCVSPRYMWEKSHPAPFFYKQCRSAHNYTETSTHACKHCLFFFDSLFLKLPVCCTEVTLSSSRSESNLQPQKCLTQQITVDKENPLLIGSHKTQRR